MDAREMLDRAAALMDEAERDGDASKVEAAQVWATMAAADASLRVATAIAHVTHRGAILTQQRGG